MVRLVGQPLPSRRRAPVRRRRERAGGVGRAAERRLRGPRPPQRIGDVATLRGGRVLMLTSTETKDIAAALVAFQAAITNPPAKRKANYGNYAALEDIIDHCREALTQRGLAVTQETVTSEGGVG